jgi:DNA-binding response OmpR family regulator
MAQARILVIDDNQAIVNLLRGVLTHAGYIVLTANDGATGLEIAQRELPDLIILDIVMPGMNGYQVCWRLQQDQRTVKIPVLILTVKGNMDHTGVSSRHRYFYERQFRDRMHGFDAGAIEFLSKPVPAGELLQRVKSLLWLVGSES